MLTQLARVVAVVALLCAAAAIATPRGRMPLALRGLCRALGRVDGQASGGEPVSAWARCAAFVLVLAAVVVSMLRL